MTLSLGGRTFQLREIVLVFVAVVAVALCALFLGLYANNKGNGGSKSPNEGVTAGMHGSNPTTAPKPTPGVCNTPMCMETTAYVWSLVNTSADPCENFYQYACGNYAERFPLKPSDYSMNVIRNLYRKNEQRIRSLLESPKTRNVPWGSERKAKDLFKSCLNEYGRMKAGANPFIEKVLNKVGGWYVLGNFQATNWDLLDNIEKVHVDFWADVLFSVRVSADWSGRSKRIIALHSPRLGMSRWKYTSSYYNETRMGYQDYMRTVAGLLVRDAGVDMPNATKTNRINVFVSDVMNMETMLANISTSSRYDFGSYEMGKRVRIKDLASITGSTFNWLSFFSYLFNQVRISKWTGIVIPQKDYIRNMAQAISNLGSNKNRILNNYFTWTLAREFIYDMSSEYIHAARNFQNIRYGSTEFTPTWEKCFSFVTYAMKDAVSRLYVQAHFGEGNKEKVREIADYIKKAFTDSVTGNDFMDKATKQYASSKIKALVENMGYPDYISDKDEVDKIYASLEIHKTDYFQNVLNVYKFLRVDLNNQLQAWRSDPDEWGYRSAIDTYHSYTYYLNKLVIPAGLLQHPIYDYHLAHYLNFGSMGYILATDYISAIDKYGSRFDRRGRRYEGVTLNPRDYYKGWWSNTTYYRYKAVSDCLVDAASNRTEGTYTNPVTGETVVIKSPVRISSYHGNNLAEEVWRIKVALRGYKAWIDKNGEEPLPMSIGLNNQQMYFIAYAQSQCYLLSDRFQHIYDIYGILRKSFTINVALSQLKEFSDAFQCSANATLAPANRCSVKL